jgi:hypothetical protein
MISISFLMVGLVIRFAWYRRRPSILACAVFWTLMAIGCAIGPAWLLPGLLCNAAATLANGGYMPVYRKKYDWEPSGIHIRGKRSHRLQMLCDRFAGASIGDFLIFGAMIIQFAYHML